MYDLHNEHRMIELEQKLTKLENKVELQENELRLNNNLLQQIKGASTLIRILFIIIGPALSGIYWLKHHLD